MPIYRVTYTLTQTAWADIEAETPEQAKEKAEDMGGENFRRTALDWDLNDDVVLLQIAEPTQEKRG